MIIEHLPCKIRKRGRSYSVSDIVVMIINLINWPMFDTTGKLTKSEALQIIKPIRARSLACTNKILDKVAPFVDTLQPHFLQYIQSSVDVHLVTDMNALTAYME